MNVILRSSREGAIIRYHHLPVFNTASPQDFTGLCYIMDPGVLPAVGSMLTNSSDMGRFQVMSKFYWPRVAASLPNIECCWVRALEDFRADPRAKPWTVEKKGYALAWITLSDKGYAGDREDLAGPLIAELVGNSLSLTLVQGHLIPDDQRRLRSLLVGLALEQQFDLILTTGGTGVGPRDVTPETTLSVIDKRLPGMEAAMLQTALLKTRHAVLSRAVVGTLGQALIINLPGSPKAVRENLTALLPALDHALAKLQGDPSDCAAVV